MQRELSQRMESVAIYEHTTPQSIVVTRPLKKKITVNEDKSHDTVSSTNAATTLTIECQGREFIVIKSLICEKSPVFRRMCNGSFRVLEILLFLSSCANFVKVADVHF